MASDDRRTRLVHICGFPSGGTSLLRNIMNSHPEIELANELPLLPQLARRFDARLPGTRVLEFAAAMRRGDVYRQLRNATADLSRLAALPSVTAEEVYSTMQTQADVAWKGHKAAYNTEDIDQLLHLFPESHFILITRDVRDVCLSWRKKWGKHELLCAEKWRARMLRGCHSIAALPEGRGMIVRYEELLRETETVGRQICQLLDLPFDSRMVAYHEHVPDSADGHKNYGRAIDPSNAGKWRTGLSDREAHRIEEIAYDTMLHLGYQPTSAHTARPISALERAIGLGSDCFATVFIGNRYKSQHRLASRIITIGVTLRRRAKLS